MKKLTYLFLILFGIQQVNAQTKEFKFSEFSELYATNTFQYLGQDDEQLIWHIDTEEKIVVYSKKTEEFKTYSVKDEIEKPKNKRDIYFYPDLNRIVILGYNWKKDIYKKEQFKATVRFISTTTFKEERRKELILKTGFKNSVQTFVLKSQVKRDSWVKSPDGKRIIIYVGEIYAPGAKIFILNEDFEPIIELENNSFKDLDFQNSDYYENDVYVDNDGSFFYLEKNKLVTYNAHKEWERWEDEIDLKTLFGEDIVGGKIHEPVRKYDKNKNVILISHFFPSKLNEAGIIETTKRSTSLLYMKFDGVTRELIQSKLLNLPYSISSNNINFDILFDDNDNLFYVTGDDVIFIAKYNINLDLAWKKTMSDNSGSYKAYVFQDKLHLWHKNTGTRCAIIDINSGNLDADEIIFSNEDEKKYKCPLAPRHFIYSKSDSKLYLIGGEPYYNRWANTLQSNYPLQNAKIAPFDLKVLSK